MASDRGEENHHAHTTILRGTCKCHLKLLFSWRYLLARGPILAWSVFTSPPRAEGRSFRAIRSGLSLDLSLGAISRIYRDALKDTVIEKD
jgi:hypothetical protein